jgi:hypothetical protein
MARIERQEDGARGGVGTMSRSGTRPRTQQAAERPRQVTEDAAVRDTGDPRRGRQPRPVPPQQRVPVGKRPVVKSPVVKRPVAKPREEAATRTAGRREPRVTAQAAGARRRTGPQAVAAPGRQQPLPRTGAPWRVPPMRRATAPEPVRPAGPQPAGPQPSGPPPAPQARPIRSARATLAGSHRMPFVLLLCGLLGGALVSALVISTTLAEGSFQINKLQDSTSALARQRQTLEAQVAQSQSAQVIEQRASQLGMRRPNELRFIDLKSGKISDDGPTWSGAVNAPGYAP